MVSPRSTDERGFDERGFDERGFTDESDSGVRMRRALRDHTVSDKRLRVVVVCHYYPPHLGGMARRHVELYAKLARSNRSG